GEIWPLFREGAFRYTPPRDFALPRTYPAWKPFERGDYAIQYVPDTTSSPTTERTTTTRAATTAEQTPAGQTTTEHGATVPTEPAATEAVTTAPPPPAPTV